MRNRIIEKIKTKKIVVIVRGVYGEDCLNLAKALLNGGIEVMEVTFDQANRDNQKKTVETIALINETLGDRMTVGAGTVLTEEMLEAAKSAGAKFIVSPDMNPDIISKTVELGMVSVPGAMTPTEILSAHKAGADFVKVFPASDLGASYIRSVKAPLNHIDFLAFGGVTEKNIGNFLKAGVIGAGVGGNLVNKEWIEAGEFDKITALAKEYVKNSNI